MKLNRLLTGAFISFLMVWQHAFAQTPPVAMEDPALIVALEAQLNTKLLKPIDQAKVRETLVFVYRRTKDYAKLIALAQTHLQATDAAFTTPERLADVRLAWLQALYFTKDYAQVAQAMPAYLQAADALPGKAADENTWRMLAHSQSQVKDRAGAFRTLQQLVARYPSKAYWRDLLSQVADQVESEPRLLLDVYRIMRLTGTLDDADDYLTLASLAQKAAQPAEALAVLEAGFAAKVLGVGPRREAHQKTKDQAALRAEEDSEAVRNAEKQALANPSDGAQQAAILGDLHFASQRWAAAATAYGQALTLNALPPSKLRREAELRMHYQAALTQSGQSTAITVDANAAGVDANLRLIADTWALLKIKP